jgi:hypothetical protein
MSLGSWYLVIVKKNRSKKIRLIGKYNTARFISNPVLMTTTMTARGHIQPAVDDQPLQHFPDLWKHFVHKSAHNNP